jgi:hypothetical protein
MAVYQPGAPDQLKHFFNACRAPGAIEAGQAIRHVGCDAHVREERRLLGNESSFAATWLEERACIGIGDVFVVENDAPAIGAVEAREEKQESALARAGGTEDDGPIGREAALDVQVEASAAGVGGRAG